VGKYGIFGPVIFRKSAIAAFIATLSMGRMKGIPFSSGPIRMLKPHRKR